MQSVSYLSEGFRIARRHKRLIIVLWLTPLIPALMLGAMAAANLFPALGGSLFADRILDGDSFIVWMEFRSSPADALEPILGRGVVVMALLTLLVQVVLSAGIVGALLERDEVRPFTNGIRENLGRFTRTAILMVIVTAVSVLLCGAVGRGFFKLAEAQRDGRFDVIGVLFALALFIVLWAPFDLASDLSRISAARHGDRSMVRGFFRAWLGVLKNPGVFVPLYLVFLLLPMVLHLVYWALRSPATPSTAAALVVLVIAQQLVMVIRAFFKLGFWGAEVAAFRGLDEPRWCRGKQKKPIEAPQAEIEAEASV
jgi:hypothetical protein